MSASSPYSSPLRRLIWSLCLLAHLLIVQFSPPVEAFSSYGGGNSLMSGGSGGGGYGNSGGSSYGGGGGSGGGSSKGPYTAAVETSRTVEVKPVQSTNEQYEPHVVEVPGDDSPVIVHFKSQSSRVLVQQTHTPAQVGEPEHTSSEDEPQRVIHEVVKPVIQEVREVIQPYRRVIQTISPIIAKGEPRPAVEPLSVPGASGGNSGSSGSGRSGSSGKSSGYGGSSGSGGYAAAASTSVSLKSSAPSSSSSSSSSSSPVKTTESRSQSVSHHVTSSSSTYHQPQSHHSSSSNANSNNLNRKYTNAQLQQIFQQSSAQPTSIAASSQYSARRGDLQESQYHAAPQSQPQPQQPQPTQTRITLRPAPVGYNGGYYRKPVVQAVHQQPQQLQPQQIQSQQIQQQQQQQQIQQSIQQVLSHIQPMSEIRGPTYYAYSDYQGAVSSLHEDDIPLLTFVAKPTRFRARARAAAAR